MNRKIWSTTETARSSATRATATTSTGLGTIYRSSMPMGLRSGIIRPRGHLAHKFRDLMRSSESKVLFYATEENGARGHFEKVGELLRGKFAATNFKIVLLQPKS